MKHIILHHLVYSNHGQICIVIIYIVELGAQARIYAHVTMLVWLYEILCILKMTIN